MVVFTALELMLPVAEAVSAPALILAALRLRLPLLFKVNDSDALILLAVKVSVLLRSERKC